MIILIVILLGLYFCVYRTSRPGAVLATARRRAIILSCTLTIFFYGFSYYKSNRPPKVNYYSTGWFWLIQDLNILYASIGSTNRIPEPGK